tara:strand:+ start:1208 stop:1489 length:282 start_codon:yes stop_codon:yes gene_type:complete
VKLKEMIELVQQHHPNMGHTEIVKLLNRAMDDFSQETRIVKDVYEFDLVKNQRYYNIDSNILEVLEVDYDSSSSGGKRIPMLTGGTPVERDIT